MKKENLIGKRFGKLTVVSESDEQNHRGHYLKVNCICDCGSTCVVRRSTLKGNGVTSTKSCGCLKKTHFINLTGNKYNLLTVEKYLGKDNSKNNIYECKCDCGKSIIAQGSDVKTGKIKSCGCLSSTKSTLRGVESGLTPLIRSVFNGYKRDRGYEFKLTMEQVEQLIKQNCHYCGSEPKNIKTIRLKTHTKVLRYNGIDRMNNDVGYVLSNVVPCCRNCNIAKHTYSVEFFKELITNIYYNFVLPSKNKLDNE